MASSSSKRLPTPPEDSSVSISSNNNNVDAKRRRLGSLGSKDTSANIDLLEYFRRLPPDSDFETLFNNVAVVLALFRGLEDSAKVIVTRMINLPEPSRWEPFIIWLRGNRKEALRALNGLRALHILVLRQQRTGPRSAVPSTHTVVTSGSAKAASAATAQQSRSPEEGSPVESTAGGSVVTSSAASSTSRARLGIADVRYELNPTFRRTLQCGFREGLASSPILGSSPHSKSAKHFPEKATLHGHAAQQWKNMLQWLCENASRDIAAKRLGFMDLLYERNQALVRAPSSIDVITVLQRLRLVPGQESMKPSEDLPNETFQWLLHDIRSQILSICIEFLRCIHLGLVDAGSFGAPQTSPASNTHVVPEETAAAQRIEVLLLLFTLSEAAIGQPCPISGLTAAQRRFIGIAYDIGLVWMHKPRGSKHFFPTPFAKLLQAETAHLTSAVSTLTALGTDVKSNPLMTSIDLPSDLYHNAYAQYFRHEQVADHPRDLPLPESNSSQSSTATESGVIVESNFKVFAYTVCSLLITVVARLCEIRVITPSLVVGTLSRDSVLEAYKSGVTADQIIRFFASHAHPSIYAKLQRQGKQILPENVATQLRIWEAERRRIRMRRACIFEFSKESDLDVFPLAVSRAGIGWLLMSTETPASSSLSSAEFQAWKTKSLDRLRTRPHGSDQQRAIAPVLAIHAQFKEEMTNFIRASMKNIKR